jgi:hypothetical protein
MECLAFNEKKITCKSNAGVSQIIAEKQAHLDQMQRDRLGYQARCAKAISESNRYWSCIIDYSQPVMMPTHYPVPKSWLHYGN